MKNTIIAFALTSACFTSQAQISISPVIGSEISNYGPGYLHHDFQVRPGVCAGALVDFPQKRKWSLQTGLLYKRNVYRSNDIFGSHVAGDFRDFRVNVLQLPVKVTLSFPMCKRHQLFIGAGPYLNMNVAASSHVHAHYYDNLGNPIILDEVRNSPIGGPLHMDRMETGAGLNVGFRAASGLLVCLQGQTGFNLEGAHEAIIEDYSFGIVAGYTFKLKKHKALVEETQPK